MDLLFFGFPEESIARHLEGDWGDLCDEDREMKDEAIVAEHKGESTDSLQHVQALRWYGNLHNNRMEQVGDDCHVPT